MLAGDKGPLMTGDWVTATATIMAAIIGIVGGIFIGRIGRERRTIRFVLATPEDLAQGLRAQGSSFEVKLNNTTTQELIVAGVTVENIGNVVINDLAFDLVIPGKHSLAQAQANGDNKKLVSDVNINFKQGLPQTDPPFVVSVPYINPGESFKISAYFDGPPQRCTVACRLPGVKIMTETEEAIERKKLLLASLLDSSNIQGIISLFVVGAIILSAIISKIASLF
jgi:hypothetical protein